MTDLSADLVQQKQKLRERLRFRRRHFAANLDGMAQLAAFRALPAPLSELLADHAVVGAYAADEMDALARHFTVHRLWEAADRDAFLAAVAPSVRAIGTKGELGANAALIGSLPHLEIIACFGVGTDAIDLNAAKARGIRVTNTPDVLTEDVADMGWALLLATARRIPAGDAHVRSRAWADGGMALTRRVWGKRLGIVGLGRIGRAVARRAEGFAMTVAYSGRKRQADVPHAWHPDPVSLAREVDFLIVCASGGEGTRNLVGAAAIEVEAG